TEEVTQLDAPAETATTSFTYDAKGRLLVTTLPDGSTRRSTWDAMGARLSTTDEKGNTFTFTTDALGLDSTVSGPMGFSQSTHFDAAGRLKTRTDNGATWTYSYDEPGWVKETLPVTNMTVRRRYNGRGQLVEVDESDGMRTTSLRYDGDVVHESITREGSWQLTSTQLVDGRGRVKQAHEVWSAGSQGYDYTTNIAWLGRVSTTSYVWKFNGQPVPSPTESATYDGLGHLSLHTIGDVTDAWDYDGAGALSRFTSADAPARTRLYGADGRLSIETFGTEATKFGYTTRGDVAAVLTPDNRLTTTQYEYALGTGRALPTRVTVSRDNESTATATAYDELSHVHSVTEGVGTADAQTSTHLYGPRGELREVTLPTAAKWTYGYDELLRLSRVTPPAGSKQKAQHFESFDGLGRLEKYRLGDTGTGSTWTTTFENGVATTGTPMGEEVAALIDGRGRTVSVNYKTATTNGAGLISKRMLYDGWNALTGLQDTYTAPTPPETSTWAYDTSHRLETVTRGGAGITYTYDGNTRRRASRGAIGWQYDSLGRLAGVSGPWGTSTVTWEPGGQRLAQLGDEAFAYDGRGWLERITSPAGTRSYSYDNRGNRTSETFNGQTRHFIIDAANRLTAVQEWDGHAEVWALSADGAKAEEKHFPVTAGWPVSFASAGQSVHRRYDYDDIGALKAVVNVSNNSDFLRYSVDKNGQVTSRTVGGQSVAYHWDVDGRLVSASMLAPGATSFTAVYGYDGLGMRRRAHVTSTPPTGPPIVSTRTWKWAGEDGEEEVDEDGN
ncbi:MAG: hypothetical protein DI536_36210, partial [Archangium gephyra]